MKISFPIFLMILLPFVGFTQNTICGTDYFLEKEYAKNPSFQNEVEQNWMVSDGPIDVSQRGARAVKIIPVVFHVFHANGTGNISYDQILSAMDMINEDFRRINSDTGLTRDIFKPYAADSEIEFRLAVIDPNGNCTNGVVRINNAQASYNATNSVKSVSRWPAEKYFNVWVVNTIESSGVPGIILGYAQFPGSGSWNTYGVVVRQDRVGRIGTATNGDRTLTHEFGHCFNLLHTFQSGCGSLCQSSGDRVCDTPPVRVSTQGCSRSQNQCSNDASGNSVFTTDVNDQIENYMSYDDCQNMFSSGQKVRMQNALANFSTLAQLVSNGNLNATGVLNNNLGICEADFESDVNTVCIGQSIQFKDLSFFNPKSFQWTFEGGNPQTSSNRNPIVTYDIPGVYKVELTVLDTFNQSGTKVKTEYITVLSSFRNTTPAQQSFEAASNLSDLNWRGEVLSSDLNWSLFNKAGFSGSNSVKAQAYNEKGRINLYSNSYDASNLSEGTLSFMYAYSPKIGESANFLKVFISNNCGETWIGKTIMGASSLATTSERSSEYTTPLASHWKYKSIKLSKSDLSENTRIRFEYNVDLGNNLFLDEVKLSGDLGQEILLSSPKNDADNISTSPTLDWKATSIVDYYEVEIDTDTLFNSPNVLRAQTTYINAYSQNTDTKYEASNLMHGQTYYWRVRTNIGGVDTAFSETWSFKVDSTVVGIKSILTSGLFVSIYPNPTRDVFYVDIAIAKNEKVSIALFNATGNRVKDVFNGLTSANKMQFQLSRNGLPAGIYFMRVVTNSEIQTKRVVIE
jgi:PKD repeat protein